MKCSGMIRVFTVAAAAALVTAWVTQDATLQKGAGAAEPQPFFMKNINVALGDDQMVNLHLMVGLGPLCSVEGVEGVQHRPLVISSVFDYGCVLAHHGAAERRTHVGRRHEQGRSLRDLGADRSHRKEVAAAFPAD